MLDFADSLLGDRALADLLQYATVAPPGNFAEFGVYRGGTAKHLAKIARQRGCLLYLFDTFAGIPFAGPHDVHKVGDFSDTSLEAVHELIPDAILVPGVFPQSIEECRVSLQPLSFVH